MQMHYQMSQRGAAVVFAIIVGLVGWTMPLVNQTAAQEIPTGVLGTPAASPECEDVGIGQAATSDAVAAVYVIVGESSAARYRVQEELASVGTTEAIGATNAIIGQILLDVDGAPAACSRFDVDLRTLKSDEVRRDNYLYDNTLETETYPLATFVLKTVEGLGEPLTADDPVTFTLIGDLTLHGVTQPVAWEATANLDDDSLTGSAMTTFQMPDLNIEKPTVRVVVSLEETVQLEIEITAALAA